MTTATREAWPVLPYEHWKATKQTLHRYTQIVGKIRMALVPFRNHWWHVALLPETRGLTTGPMPFHDRWVEIRLDLLDHNLEISTSDGGEQTFVLGRRPACADFYRDLFAALHEVGVEVEICAKPFDLGDSPPFAEDTIHDSYDATAVTRFWQILSSTTRVLDELRSDFVGKQSPAHLFWHSFDLAHSRYSGRRAPVPEDADRVSAEAYSHEAIAFGFWPGDDRRTPYPAFYSYTAPETDGLREHPLDPKDASWQDTGAGSLAVLPYDAMAADPDPHGTLLAFYESAYRAGARNANWDHESLAHRGQDRRHASQRVDP